MQRKLIEWGFVALSALGISGCSFGTNYRIEVTGLGGNKTAILYVAKTLQEQEEEKRSKNLLTGNRQVNDCYRVQGLPNQEIYSLQKK